MFQRHPGWALLDHLCVAQNARNGGIGAMILRSLLETEPDTVFFGEVEEPADAPDPEMADSGLKIRSTLNSIRNMDGEIVLCTTGGC